MTRANTVVSGFGDDLDSALGPSLAGQLSRRSAVRLMTSSASSDKKSAPAAPR